MSGSPGAVCNSNPLERYSFLSPVLYTRCARLLRKSASDRYLNAAANHLPDLQPCRRDQRHHLPRVLTCHRFGHIALIRSGHEVVKPIDQSEALAGAAIDDMTASILARACALSDRSVRDDEI